MSGGVRRLLVIAGCAGGVVLVIATNPPTTRSACTRGREPVETLSDLDRYDVRFTPVPSTVPALGGLREPSGDTASRRTTPVETTTYRIRVALVAMRRLRSGDIALTVAAPGDGSKTMIVTFPGPACGRRASRKRKREMRAAARALVSACGEPTRRAVALTGDAEVVGVGMFGGKRRAGAAPNGIELSPVLALGPMRCRRAAALRR